MSQCHKHQLKGPTPYDQSHSMRPTNQILLPMRHNNCEKRGLFASQCIDSWLDGMHFCNKNRPIRVPIDQTNTGRDACIDQLRKKTHPKARLAWQGQKDASLLRKSAVLRPLRRARTVTVHRTVTPLRVQVPRPLAAQQNRRRRRLFCCGRGRRT